jgi:hypothetical protein
MKSKSVFLGLVVPVFALLGACTHTPLNFGELQLSEDCSPDTAYFVNNAFPIINSSCAKSGCHDAISSEEDVDLSSWNAIMNSDVVKPGNPDGSKLYEVLFKSGEDRMPPPPELALSDGQKAVIRLWIEQGALNNECIGACDTSVVTYSGSIVPLMSNNCIGCHSGASPSGGISLTSYSDVAVVAGNGKLYGTVAGLSGYSSMPPGVSLNDCLVETIRLWVENGCPND